MALAQTGIRTITNRLPKVISPRNHAIIDYISAGSFALGAVLMWKNHKRAAIAAIGAAAAEANNVMMTKMPGGVWKLYSQDTHAKLDVVLSGSVEAIPNLLMFGDEWPAWFFRAKGLMLAAVTGMTDFDFERQSSSSSRRRNRSAA
jgi:hypothetical protein